MVKRPQGRSYSDLQDHLSILEKNNLLNTIARSINKDTEVHPLVRWQFCGGIAEDERKGFLFTAVSDSKNRAYDRTQVAVGVLSANPQIYALGMNCSIDQIGKAWIDAIANPVAPRVVDSAACQEIVLTGKDVSDPGKGLEALPIPVSTPGFDVAPYLTAGLWITRDPDTGVQNMGVYRGNLKAADRLCVMMEKATLAGGYVHWTKYRDRNEPMPFAVVLGAPPVVEFLGPQKLPIGVDELTVAGGLAKGPINVVKCRTVDLLVPAEANVVIEGLIDTETLEPEGPFGESHGYMQIEEYNMIARVTAITRRKDAIITSIISQVTPSESSVIKKLAYEPLFLEHLRDRLNIKSVKRVSLHEPWTNLRKFVFVTLERGAAKTEVWRALAGASSLQPAIGKFCVAINEDVNPDNANHVLWAIAYRCNPVDDIQIVNYKSAGHAPRTAASPLESIVLIDATLKVDFPPVALPKREYMENAKRLWAELGLPPLKPESPWFGYSLGEWNDDWDKRASLAAAGDWLLNGLDSAKRARAMREPNVTVSDVLPDGPQSTRATDAKTNL
nr:UbiD family decarboxylase [Roseiarcus fermentans]